MSLKLSWMFVDMEIDQEEHSSFFFISTCLRRQRIHSLFFFRYPVVIKEIPGNACTHSVSISTVLY